MKTTLQQIELLGEVLDFTDFATQENLDTAKDEILNAVENAKPEIDTSAIAKQGENPDATMSAVLEEVMKLNGSFAEQIHNIVGE